MSRTKGCVHPATNVVEDGDKKSSEATAAAAGDDNAADNAADSNNSTDTEMTPTKKAARTFSQLESESAAAPVSVRACSPKTIKLYCLAVALD